MFRTRFKKEIVAEFLPPARSRQKQRVIFLCDGMPSVPRKQPLAQFLSQKGYWVIYPRWRGAWESDGQFLKLPPQQDLSDIIDELPKGLRESAFGRKFKLAPDEIFVIGGSFGGAAAILASLDPRIKRVIANCPVVDWSILPKEQKKETSNKSYVAYIRESFGNGYRLSEKNWNKLSTGTFYNPIHHIKELTPEKIMMFHAKDDPYIPWKSVMNFASSAGIKLRLLSRGGHVKTEYIVQKYWPQIKNFFES
ncbi:MAG TPA: prolyl oligopeptidase family serine peptidase [Candidatus Angelobacter sp.]|jgi:esterase/lipase|nr:prolyl oligopeptidase family serine peptidase [Candidatus Angelobacter sp.]